jgi:hypothetical protein
VPILDDDDVSAISGVDGWHSTVLLEIIGIRISPELIDGMGMTVCCECVVVQGKFMFCLCVK